MQYLKQYKLKFISHFKKANWFVCKLHFLFFSRAVFILLVTEFIFLLKWERMVCHLKTLFFTTTENLSLDLILDISPKMQGLFILKRKVETFSFHNAMKQSFLKFECQSELTLLTFFSAKKLIAKTAATKNKPQFFHSFTNFFLKKKIYICNEINKLCKQCLLENLYYILYQNVWALTFHHKLLKK